MTNEMRVALVSVVAALIGLMLTQWYNRQAEIRASKISRDAETRAATVRYLLDAYRRLESAVQRIPMTPEFQRRIEDGLGDVQLLGSPGQDKLAKAFARAIENRDIDGAGEIFSELLMDLRRDLREQLQLDPISEPQLFVRMSAG